MVLKKMPIILIIGMLTLCVGVLCACGNSDMSEQDNTSSEESTTESIDYDDVEGHYEYSDEYGHLELDIVYEDGLKALSTQEDGTGSIGVVDEMNQTITFENDEGDKEKYEYELINGKLVAAYEGKKDDATAYEKTKPHNPIIEDYDEIENQTFHLLTDDEETISGTLDISEDDRVLLAYTSGETYTGTIDYSGVVTWDDDDEGKCC